MPALGLLDEPDPAISMNFPTSMKDKNCTFNQQTLSYRLPAFPTALCKAITIADHRLSQPLVLNFGHCGVIKDIQSAVLRLQSKPAAVRSVAERCMRGSAAPLCLLIRRALICTFGATLQELMKLTQCVHAPVTIRTQVLQFCAKHSLKSSYHSLIADHTVCCSYLAVCPFSSMCLRQAFVMPSLYTECWTFPMWQCPHCLGPCSSQSL
jgi:hypothetical protein